MTPSQLFFLGLIGQIILGVVLYLQGKNTHTLINSRMDEQLKMSGESERAKGVLEGRAAGNRERGERMRADKKRRK